MTNLLMHRLPKKQNELVQYNAAIATTGVIKGSSCEKIVPLVRTGISFSKKMCEKMVLFL